MVRNAEDQTGPGNSARSNDRKESLEDSVLAAKRAFRGLDDLLAEVGGVGSVVGLYDSVRRHLDQVEYAELDRVAGEIRVAVERLLEMDQAVRKLSNLKVLFDRERHGLDREGA